MATFRGWPDSRRDPAPMQGPGGWPGVGNLAGWPNIRRRINPAHPINQGLLHWWPMDEGSGAGLADMVGPQTAIQISGYAAPGSGRVLGPRSFGSALLLDGTDDYAPFSVPAHLGAWSICGWIRPDAWEYSSPYERTIVGVYTTNYARLFFGGAGVAGNKQRLAVDTGYATYISTVDQTLAAWIYVCGTANASTLRIYVNGVEIGNGASAATMQNSGTWNIGKLSSYGRYFNGGMAHMRLYSRVISATEAQQLYADPWIGAL